MLGLKLNYVSNMAHRKGGHKPKVSFILRGGGILSYLRRHHTALRSRAYIDGLLLDSSISSALAMEIHKACTKATICKMSCHLISQNLEATRLVLTHWGRDKMAAIFQTTFSNGFSWMKMYEFRLTFHWSLCLGVQFTIFQHWFR